MKKFLKNLKGRISLFVVMMMILSMTMVPVFAKDNDPNMTAYNDQFTYVVNRTSSVVSNGTSIDIYAVPADSDYEATVFDTSTAAENVVWTGYGGNTSGITMGATSSYAIPGGYASKLTVNIAPGTQAGPASFLATNPINGGYVNITVVLNNNANNDSTFVIAPAVLYQIYTSPTAAPIQDISLFDLDAAMHTDNRSYVTVFDSVQDMENIGLIDSYDEIYGYISSMEIDGHNYSDGWQYRVYALNYDTFEYEVIELSEVLGIGDMDISSISIDLVQWRYGDYNEVTFPDSIPVWSILQ